MISFRNNVCSVVTAGAAAGGGSIEDEQVFDFRNNVLSILSMNKFRFMKEGTDKKLKNEMIKRELVSENVSHSDWVPFFI